MLQWMLGDCRVFVVKNRAGQYRGGGYDYRHPEVPEGALGIIEATTAARADQPGGSSLDAWRAGTVVIGGFAVNKMDTWTFEEKQRGDERVLEEFSVNPKRLRFRGHQAPLL